MEYINLAYHDNFDFPNVIVADNHRVTIGVWVFMSGIDNLDKLIHIVLPDHIVITLRKPQGDAANAGNIDSICILHEFQNILKDNSNGTIDENIENPSFSLAATYPPHGYAYDKVTMNKIEGFWFYTRCAINADTSNFYVMGSFKISDPYASTYSKHIISPSSDPKLQIYPKENIYPEMSKLNTATPHPYKSLLKEIKTDTVYRKFYRNTGTATTSLKIKMTQTWADPATKFLFFKNLYVFNEYLPSSSNFHY